MKYTLTRVDLDGDNDRYPLQKQEIVSDPLSRMPRRAFLWASSTPR